MYDEMQDKPRLGNTDTLRNILTEIHSFFAQRGTKLNFAGLTETYKDYTLMKVENLFGLWNLIFELDAWQTYLEEFYNMCDSIQKSLECSIDYLESLKGERSNEFADELTERKFRVKQLGKLKKELELHVKKLSECSAYCKALFNRQLKNYRKR